MSKIKDLHLTKMCDMADNSTKYLQETCEGGSACGVSFFNTSYTVTVSSFNVTASYVPNGSA